MRTAWTSVAMKSPRKSASLPVVCYLLLFLVQSIEHFQRIVSRRAYVFIGVCQEALDLGSVLGISRKAENRHSMLQAGQGKVAQLLGDRVPVHTRNVGDLKRCG